MRILHTADWHLGKQLHGTSFLEDQAFVLQEFQKVVQDVRPDCVVVAGDIFDRSVPSADAVSLLDETLSKLVKDFKKPIFLIAGNHDSPERIGFLSDPLVEAGVYLHGRYATDVTPILLSDKFGEVAICPLPYLEPAIAREELSDPELGTHEGAMRAACAHVRKQIQTRRSVLIAHAFVAGGVESDSERPLTIGGSSLIPAEVFQGFSYTALGHLHRPQTMKGSEGAVRYSGSLLKYSFSEINHKKTYSLVEIDANGCATWEEIPIVPRRDLRELKGSFHNILDRKIEVGNVDDYLVVELENRETILDAMARLREVFPNILHLRKPHLEFSSNGNGVSKETRKGDFELFQDFFSYVQDQGLTSAQERFVKKALDEVNQAGEER